MLFSKQDSKRNVGKENASIDTTGDGNDKKRPKPPSERDITSKGRHSNPECEEEFNGWKLEKKLISTNQFDFYTNNYKILNIREISSITHLNGNFMVPLVWSHGIDIAEDMSAVWIGGDLDNNCIGIYISRELVQHLPQMRLGSVFAVLDPRIIVSDGKKGKLLLLSNVDQIIGIGSASHAGLCAAPKCGFLINCFISSLCDYHLLTRVNKIKANRMNINDEFTTGLSKNQLKKEFSNTRNFLSKGIFFVPNTKLKINFNSVVFLNKKEKRLDPKKLLYVVARGVVVVGWRGDFVDVFADCVVCTSLLSRSAPMGFRNVSVALKIDNLSETVEEKLRKNPHLAVRYRNLHPNSVFLHCDES